ncbi:ran binding protein 9-related protein [Babesia gibsoni]|uniref:Ran binding protein 9-related protein n=1 Tax=Babesia gibsoni TaxID=33632 RepID=A0AAD8LR32_BABGI|nr:ran binding protein 9-related protein [Babesia gibsoni]
MSDLAKLLYGNLEYPTCLETRGNQPYVTIYKDRLTYKFSGKRRYSEPGSVQSNVCAPKDCVLYYFEVEILSSDTPASAVVGFSKLNYYHNRHPGSQPSSIGYHGENGNRSNGSGKCVSYGASYGAHDVIGCGINYIDQCYFFTRNGKHQGNAGDLHHCDNYPIAGLERKGDMVKFNFEGPFRFDIEKEYRRIIAHERRQINRQSCVDDTMKRIVYLYLMHRGYKRTMDSFKTESGVSLDEHDAENNSKECTVCNDEKMDDDSKPCPEGADDSAIRSTGIYITDSTIEKMKGSIDTRQQVLQKVKSGNILEAIKLLEKHYPDIDKKSYMYSHLLIQHFKELVRNNKTDEALSWFKENYDFKLTRRSKEKELLEDTMSILCYKDSDNAAFTDDIYNSNRQVVAEHVNGLMLGEDRHKNSLKALVQFITLGRALIRSKNGDTGPKYSSAHICRPMKSDM